MKNRVLAIAVHPDDETLGCGGTLLKHKDQNDEIHWLICTTISKDHPRHTAREEELKKVEKAYKFDSVYNLELKTMQVDEYTMSELIGKISEVISHVKPAIIYLPFKHDVHSDHRVIFEAAYSCTKSFRYSFVKKVYMIETLSETEFAPSIASESFIPNVYVDISQFLAKKIEIMKIYESEVDEHPFPRSTRSIKALATLRGATAGCEYAESFMLLKEIR